MKLFFKILLHSFVFASIVACSDDGIGDASSSGDDSKSVCYILNSGDWKSNNSSLTMYDESTGNAVQNYFALQNGGRGLGNTANDMIVYGSKIYIAVAGESTIEVAGLDAKSIRYHAVRSLVILQLMKGKFMQHTMMVMSQGLILFRLRLRQR